MLLLALSGWAFQPSRQSTLLLSTTQADDSLGPPAVTVEPLETAGQPAEISIFAARLDDQIENGLSADDDLVVRRPGFPTPEVRRFSYKLLTRISSVANGHYDFAFKLIRQPSGEIIWSRIFENQGARGF